MGRGTYQNPLEAQAASFARLREDSADLVDLAHVFEPYFTTKSGKKGTGLGLFITRKIVEDHRGHIDVGSHFGEGTSVTIWLPLWQDAQSGT